MTKSRSFSRQSSEPFPAQKLLISCKHLLLDTLIYELYIRSKQTKTTIIQREHAQKKKKNQVPRDTDNSFFFFYLFFEKKYIFLENKGGTQMSPINCQRIILLLLLEISGQKQQGYKTIKTRHIYIIPTSINIFYSLIKTMLYVAKQFKLKF